MLSSGGEGREYTGTLTHTQTACRRMKFTNEKRRSEIKSCSVLLSLLTLLPNKKTVNLKTGNA